MPIRDAAGPSNPAARAARPASPMRAGPKITENFPTMLKKPKNSAGRSGG